LKKLILVLAALLLAALPLASACGGDGEEAVAPAGEAKQHYDKGVEYGQQGRFDEAIAEYTKAILLDSSLAEAYSNRGNAYRALGEVQRAIADYAEAILLDPQDAGTYASRALAYTALGKDRSAEQDIDKAVEFGFDADLLRAAVEELKAQR
jgi:tetratricopeptide (TPR) repeat protein